MTRKEIRTIESPSGLGQVFSGEREIADVMYDLRVVQEFHITRGDSPDIPGLRDTTGFLKVIPGQKNFFEEESLTLHLDDGRKWDFLIKQAKRLEGSYEVVNRSGGLQPIDS